MEVELNLESRYKVLDLNSKPQHGEKYTILGDED